jgi:hypothetical protein
VWPALSGEWVVAAEFTAGALQITTAAMVAKVRPGQAPSAVSAKMSDAASVIKALATDAD